MWCSCDVQVGNARKEPQDQTSPEVSASQLKTETCGKDRLDRRFAPLPQSTAGTTPAVTRSAEKTSDCERVDAMRQTVRSSEA